MNKIFFIIILSFLVTMPAMADVCGHVIKGSKNAQLILAEGKVKTHLNKDELFSCGSMLITHEDSVWIELSDLSQFKIAPNSFMEFGKKESSRYKLYRGEMMVSAPPSIREFEITTPNSVSLFNGGVMLLRYVPKSKETSLASFNRKIEFKNKFHTEAKQVVNAGEISRLWIGESRIVPSQPEVMNPLSVKTAFQCLGLGEDEVSELTAVVERTVQSRSKSFIADLESWENLESETGNSLDRSVASVSSKLKKSESSIDPKEADVGLALMKKHLYGDDEDQRIFEDSRKPASIRETGKIKDVEYQRKKAKENVEVNKVLENIRNFNPEND